MSLPARRSPDRRGRRPWGRARSRGGCARDLRQVGERGVRGSASAAENLAVPKAKGMTTTLVTTKPGRLDPREAHDQAISDAAKVADFVTDDLAEFLAQLNSHLTE